MRNVLRISLFCGVFACSTPPAEEPKPEPIPSGELRGLIVVAGPTGSQPRADVVVRLEPGRKTARTATDGKFHFDGLASGTYALRCELDTDGDGRNDTGFFEPAITIGAAGSAGVDAGELVAAKPGALDGVVRNGGALAPGILVAVAPDFTGGSAEQVAATDSEGAFRIEGLLPGPYRVRAIRRESPAAAAEVVARVSPSGVGTASITLRALDAATTRISATILVPAGSDVQVPIDVKVTSDTDNVSKEVLPDVAFDLPLPPGIYTVRLKSRDAALAELVLPALTLTGPLRFAGLSLLPADPALTDADGDGVPASTDPDDDNDGCPDASEPAGARGDPRSCLDTDGDGLGDGRDLDDDGDGQLDALDPCPVRTDVAGALAPDRCAAYPLPHVLLGLDASAIVDEPSRIALLPTASTGAVVLALDVAPPGDAPSPTLVKGDDSTWLLTATKPGSYAVRATITDSVGVATADGVLLVEAPAIPLELEAERSIPVDVVSRISVRSPLAGTTFAWHETTPGATPLTITGADTDTVEVLPAASGDYTVVVEATRGARSGVATVTLHASGAPLEITVPDVVETTVGESFTVAAAVAEFADGVSFVWTDVTTDGAPLTLEHGTEPQVAGIAGESGERRLRVSAVRGGRSGSAEVRVVAFAVSTISIPGDAKAPIGVATRFALSISPAFTPTKWTVVQVSGAAVTTVLTAEGFVVTPVALGSCVFDLEGRDGPRVARGRLGVTAIPTPIPIEVTVAPRPFITVNAPVAMTASAGDLPTGTAVTWTWTSASSNPAAGALSSTSAASVSFTPTATGRFVFDVVAAAAGRTGTARVAFDVTPAPPIVVGMEAQPVRPGEKLYMYGDWQGRVSDAAVFTWTQAPGNPAVLALTANKSYAYADVTTPGRYTFTFSIVDGARSGSTTFDVVIVPDEGPEVALWLQIDNGTVQAGVPFALILRTNSDVGGVTTAWAEGSGNQAPLEDRAAQSRKFVATAPAVGWYEVTANLAGTRLSTVTPVTGTAKVRFFASPPIPVEIKVNSAVIGGNGVQLEATSPEPGLSPFFNWKVVSSSVPLSLYQPYGQYVGFMPERGATYTLEASTRSYGRTGSARITLTVTEDYVDPTFDIPGQEWWANPNSALDAAIGVPISVRIAPLRTKVTSVRWQQSAGPAATLVDADKLTMRFTPTQPGDYVFTTDIQGPNYASGGGGAIIRVAATQPDVYISGHPGVVAGAPQSGVSRQWACRSGRADAVSFEWTRVGDPIDGDELVDREWLALIPASTANPIAAWKCTVTTSGGQKFSKTMPIVVLPPGRAAHDVYWVKPGGAGTGRYDSPGGNLYTIFFNCFVGICSFQETHDTTVLFPENYVFPGRFDHAANVVLGGINPQTWKFEPATSRTTVQFLDAEPNGAIVNLAANTIRGLTFDVRGKSTNKQPLQVIRSHGRSTVLQNTFDVQATPDLGDGGQDAAVYLSTDTNSATTSPAIFADNRIRLRGGGGAGVLRDTCRGTSFAHNLIDVAANSTVASIFSMDCSDTGQQAPMEVTSNVIYAANGARLLEAWGSPATDSGGRFGGNWFSTTAPVLVSALRQVPLPLSIATLAALNAGRLSGGLDGGGNTTAAGCFPSTVPTDLWAFPVATGTCATGAVSPNPVRVTNLRTFARDAFGNTRDVTKYGTAIAIGPRQQ